MDIIITVKTLERDFLIAVWNKKVLSTLNDTLNVYILPPKQGINYLDVGIA